MSSKKNTFNAGTVRTIKQNPKWVFFYIIFVAVFLFFYLAMRINTWNTLHAAYSLADCYTTVEDAWFMGIIYMTVTMLLVQKLEYQSLSLHTVLRSQSRSQLWVSQTIRQLVYSILCSLFLTLITGIIGGLSTTSFINWNQLGTVFNRVTEAQADTAFLPVLTVFFITACLKTFIVCMLFQLLNWWTRSIVIGWIVFLIPAAIEFISSKFYIFFRLISAYYTHWLTKMAIPFVLILGIIISAILFIIGLIISRRKDFLNEI